MSKDLCLVMFNITTCVLPSFNVNIMLHMGVDIFRGRSVRYRTPFTSCWKRGPGNAHLLVSY